MSVSEDKQEEDFVLPSWFMDAPQLIHDLDVSGLKQLLESMSKETYFQFSDEVMHHLFGSRANLDQNHVFVPMMLEFDAEGMTTVSTLVLRNWLMYLEDPQTRPSIHPSWEKLLHAITEDPKKAYQGAHIIQESFVSDLPWVCEDLLSRPITSTWDVYAQVDMAFRCFSPARRLEWAARYEQSLTPKHYAKLWEKLILLPMMDDQNKIDPTLYTQWRYPTVEQKDILEGASAFLSRLKTLHLERSAEWIEEALVEFGRFQPEPLKAIQTWDEQILVHLEKRLLELSLGSPSSVSMPRYRKI